MTLVLEPSLPGDYEIPGLEVRIVGPEGVEKILTTPPDSIPVRSLLPADNTGLEPRAAAGRDRSGSYFLWALGACVFLGLALWIGITWRGRRSALDQESDPAAEALAAAEGQDAANVAALRAATLRYLRKRFAVDGEALTAEELVDRLELEGNERDLLGQIFAHLDGVRFGKAESAREPAGRYLAEFVRRTTGSRELSS